MKYQKRLHWDRHRPEFLKVGFIFSLALVFMAFNYTSKLPVIVPFEVGPLEPDFEVIPPTTAHQKKPLPPPPPEKIKIVDVEPVTDPIIEYEKEVTFEDEIDASADLESSILSSETAPMVQLIKAEEAEDDVPLLFAERMPIYGDCNVNDKESQIRDCSTQNLIEHTYAYVKYPALARKYEIEGTVVVSFIVSKTGQVEDIKVVKDIGMGCGDEVIRAIKKLSTFLPGKQNGRPVSVIYRLPVHFKLQ